MGEGWVRLVGAYVIGAALVRRCHDRQGLRVPQGDPAAGRLSKQVDLLVDGRAGGDIDHIGFRRRHGSAPAELEVDRAQALLGNVRRQVVEDDVEVESAAGTGSYGGLDGTQRAVGGAVPWTAVRGHTIRVHIQGDEHGHLRTDEVCARVQSQQPRGRSGNSNHQYGDGDDNARSLHGVRPEPLLCEGGCCAKPPNNTAGTSILGSTRTPSILSPWQR